jgi:hypothetical protein
LPERFLDFPILILDECIGDIIYHTKTIDLAIAIKGNPIFEDQKSLVDFKNRLCIVNNSYAQNLLDHYPFALNRRKKTHNIQKTRQRMRMTSIFRPLENRKQNTRNEALNQYFGIFLFLHPSVSE